MIMVIFNIAACAGILSVIVAVMNAVYIAAMIISDKTYLCLLIVGIVCNIAALVYLILPFFGFAHVDEPFEYMIFVAGSAVVQLVGIPVGVSLAFTWKYFSGLKIRLTNR